MKVARWGNSLAVRLPRSVVAELALAEGDEVTLSARAPGNLVVERDRRREAAMERIRSMDWSLPSDYKFDREEANARGPGSESPWDDR